MDAARRMIWPLFPGLLEGFSRRFFVGDDGVFDSKHFGGNLIWRVRKTNSIGRVLSIGKNSLRICGWHALIRAAVSSFYPSSTPLWEWRSRSSGLAAPI